MIERPLVAEVTFCALTIHVKLWIIKNLKEKVEIFKVNVSGMKSIVRSRHILIFIFTLN